MKGKINLLSLILMLCLVGAVSATVYEDALVKSADFLMGSIDSSDTWEGGWHKKSYEDDNSLYDTEWDNGYTTGFSDDSVLATSNAIINLLKAYDATDDVAKKADYLSAAQTAGDLLINVFIRADGHFEMTPVEVYMPTEVCCEWKTKIVKNFGTAWVMLYEKTSEQKYKDAAIEFGDYFLTEAGRDTDPESDYYGAIYTSQDRREDVGYQNYDHYIGSYSTGVIKSWVDIYGITGDSTYLDAAMLAAQAFIKYQFGSSYATKETVQNWYTNAAATPPDDADWAQMEGAFMQDRFDNGISQPETYPETRAIVSYTYYTSHLVKDLAVLHAELVSAGRTSDANEIENSLIAFGDWLINSDVQDGSGYFNNYYDVTGDVWSVSNAEVRTTAPTTRALLAVYEGTGDTDYLIAANKAVNWLLAEGHGYYPATGKESRYSNYIDVSYTSYSQVPFALAMAEAAESIPTEVYVDDDDATCGGDSPCFDLIQEGIDAVAESGTVNVAAGTYNEQVVINKQLTLNGANADVNAVTGARGSESIIDGGTSTALTISADDVIVDGFTLDGGITLDDSVNPVSGGAISNNIITGADNSEGIKAQNGIRLGFNTGLGVDYVTIENNIISDNGDVLIEEGKGIIFANPKLGGGTASYITISGNEIKNSVSAGIETYGPGFNTIINNIISDNGGNGINLKFDDGDVVTGNIITNNDGPGITLRQVTNSVVENNSVSGHISEDVIGTCPTVIGGRGSGIHIFDVSEDNTIRFNDISGNNYGIFIHSKGDLQPSSNSIAYNNIAGNIYYGILNALVEPITSVNAENNWWGSADGPSEEGSGTGDHVSENVDYKPWYIDSAMTMLLDKNLQENQTLADEANLIVDETTIELVVPVGSPIQEINVPSTVPEDKEVSLDLSSLLNSTTNEVSLTNNLTLKREGTIADYTVDIPEETIITGDSDWDGSLILPTVKDNADYTAPSGSVDVVIDMGSGSELNGSELNFSKAVKIVIGGQAGKKAAWSRGTTLADITTLCDNATDPENVDPDNAPRECYVNDGSDLLIWTYHFTKFAAYTPASTTTATSDEGSGGGRRRKIRIVTPVPAPGEEETAHEEFAEIASEEEVVPTEKAPSEAEAVTSTAPRDLGAIFRNIIRVATGEKKSVGIGSLIIIVVVGGLFLFSQFYGGMPGVNHFTRAANFHKRAEKANTKRKHAKSEKLYKKSQILQEEGKRRLR